ncbi:DUF2931 family protein [Aeromonas sp. 1HA1]|uniref:DUF2931 family protein n=1 Tax=Aeromonas sp. 1HA1 TaxID=2699193 RepID=UPI0023DDAD8F|nr:DUF2931 family protein [Aeromonas sp. 1HA1]
MVGGIDKSLFEFSRVIGSAFTAAIGTAIGVHHFWFPLLFSGNYFVHNCLHSPDGSGRTLTKDLGKQMAQRYRLKGERIAQRNYVALGLAPGGYVEVFLRSPDPLPDVLVASGMAHEVTDDWYDKKVPLNRQYGIDEFTERFGALYQKNPIPTGEAWAPIMEAYRAAQPKTDTDPVQ